MSDQTVRDGSRVGHPLVAGHTLEWEGRPYHSAECDRCAAGDYSTPGWRGGSAGIGHGRCSCGAQSVHLVSGAARKRWHREHKASVVASLSSDVEGAEHG